MDIQTQHILYIIAGFVLLFYSADHLVDGAVNLSKKFDIPSAVIGLTVVAFATSLPELMVSGLATTKDSVGIAVGNIIGSNISNIGLVLGVASIIAPIAVSLKDVGRDIVAMIATTMLAVVFLLDGELSKLEGLFLLASLIVFLGLSLHSALKGKCKIEEPDTRSGKIIVPFIFGFLGIYLGSELLVRGSINIAEQAGLSEMFVGIIIVAIGTSLPELAATVMSSIRGYHGISLGNILGSNIFNTAFVLAVCPFKGEIKADINTLSFELAAVVLISLCLPLLIFLNKKKCLSRFGGATLLSAYFAIIVLLTMRTGLL